MQDSCGFHIFCQSLGLHLCSYSPPGRSDVPHAVPGASMRNGHPLTLNTAVHRIMVESGSLRAVTSVSGRTVSSHFCFSCSHWASIKSLLLKGVNDLQLLSQDAVHKPVSLPQRFPFKKRQYHVNPEAGGAVIGGRLHLQVYGLKFSLQFLLQSIRAHLFVCSHEYRQAAALPCGFHMVISSALLRWVFKELQDFFSN